MRRTVALLVLLSLFTAGCGTRDLTPEEKLRKFLDSTEEVSRKFTYSTKVAGKKTSVDGEIQDDFRNHAQLSLEGALILERIVSDDALAVRIVDASKVPGLDGATVGGSVIIGDALRAGRWVLDPTGAPPLIAARAVDPRAPSVGADPVQDSIKIFTYAVRSMDEALGVIEFNENSPNYRPDLDPFDKPNEQLGIKRFDLIRVPLPGRNSRSQILPGVGSFRKMSFYVRDGKVVKIVEKIDIRSHEEFEKARTDDRKKYLLEIRDAVLAGKSPTPVVVREMSTVFTDLAKDVLVMLPTDALTTSLKFLFGPATAPAPVTTTATG
ncbi:MAG: hypothetical protein ABIS18_06810 [Actinomycetota bacterium]